MGSDKYQALKLLVVLALGQCCRAVVEREILTATELDERVRQSFFLLGVSHCMPVWQHHTFRGVPMNAADSNALVCQQQVKAPAADR